MSRDTAKGFYDKNPGDPESGYVTPADAQAALDVVYDDMQADVGGADAINAKLGAAPQGSNSTVQERLEQIEAGVNLAAQSVTSDKIANGTIVDADINAGAAVAPGKIAGTAVTRSDTGTVTSAMIENGTIGDADINAAAAIDKSKIAGVAVTRADVDAIPASMLEDGSITNAKVANNAAIDKAKIAGTAIVSTDSGVVTTGMIADGTIVNGDINPSANIDPAKIAGTAVTQGQSGSVTGPMIANGTISDAQINANAAIGKGKIAGVAVTQADSATVSGAMIKQNTVTGSNLVNDTITATQIAANAVGASELADNAVDTAAIAANAVTSAKIADGTITSTDVAASTFAAFGTVGNLLTANVASGTDYSGDMTGFALPGASGAASTDYAASGTKSVKVTSVGSSPRILSGSTGAASSGTIPVIAGATYTFLTKVYAPSVTYSITPSVFWYQADGTTPASTTYNSGPAVTLAASWQQTRMTVTAPANAAFAYVRLAGSGGFVANDVFYTDEWSLHRGSGGTFVLPGVPVPGQGAIKANGAVELPGGDYSPEGAVTAKPGSTFLQTSGAATVTGMLSWRKATGTGNTGWVAEGALADTGWRDVSSIVTPGSGITVSALNVRRVGNRVTVRMSLTGFTAVAGAQANLLLNGSNILGSGFAPAGGSAGLIAGTATWLSGNKACAVHWHPTDATASYGLRATNFSASDASSQTVNGQLTWFTDGAWPTSLPGSAA